MIAFISSRKINNYDENFDSSNDDDMTLVKKYH